jgi:hypothetical protein
MKIKNLLLTDKQEKHGILMLHKLCWLSATYQIRVHNLSLLILALFVMRSCN